MFNYFLAKIFSALLTFSTIISYFWGIIFLTIFLRINAVLKSIRCCRPTGNGCSSACLNAAWPRRSTLSCEIAWTSSLRQSKTAFGFIFSVNAARKRLSASVVKRCEMKPYFLPEGLPRMEGCFGAIAPYLARNASPKPGLKVFSDLRSAQCLNSLL